MTRAPLTRRGQGGATLVEFALGLVIFLTFFLGVMDFSRMLWTWAAANEATRWGARLSVVCGKGASTVLDSMQKWLPQLKAEQLQVNWYAASGLDNSCTVNTCTGVQVRIVGLDYQWISPIGWTAGRVVPMPSFATFLPRESMGLDAQSSAICNPSPSP